MTPIYIIIQPFNPLTGLRETVRVASASGGVAFGIEGVSWTPAVVQRPVLSIELMSPDLDGRVQAGRCSFSLNLNAFAGAAIMAGWKWLGAPIVVYSAPSLALPAEPDFAGLVTTPSLERDTLLLGIQASVDTTFLDKPLLTAEFDGTGGSGGDAEARGTLKPAGFGACENIPPVWFDKTNWIGMIDGYANTAAITRLTEGLNDFGPAVANYPTYDALKNAIVAKAVAPGRWATCVAEGLVALGAPPVKPIGVNAIFDASRLGAMATRILEIHAAVPAPSIDLDAFAALDEAVPYETAFWTGEQRTVQELLEAMAASANATPLVTGQGKVTITRAVTSDPVATLDRSGGVEPRVTDWQSAAPVAPVWRLAARVARPASVIDLKDVLYEDDLVDRGGWVSTETYRQGHYVWMPDKSSWLYIGETPTAGYPPPSWPTTSDDWWQNLSPPLEASAIGVEPGATRNAPGQALQDTVFSQTYWTLPPAATVFSWAQFPAGVGLQIDFAEGVDNFAFYAGTLGTAMEVEPGRRVFFRLETDTYAGVVEPVTEDGEPVTEGGDPVYASVLAAPDWDLEVIVDWLTPAGVFLSRAALGSVAPEDAGTFTANAVPPAGARLASVAFGHSAQAGRTGSWAVYSPWAAEYQPASDVTSENAPFMPVVPDQTIAADSVGDPLAGQLPRTISFRRQKGDADVTTLADWTIEAVNADVTIDNDPGSPDRGDVVLAGIEGNAASFTVTSTNDGVPLSQLVKVTLSLAPPPSSGTPGSGGGGNAPTSVNVSFAGVVGNSSYGAASASATVNVTTGSITAFASTNYFSDGNPGDVLAGKFQYGPAGAGTWTDLGAEVPGSISRYTVSENELVPGGANISQSATGLAAGDYDVRLLLRVYLGSGADAYGTINLTSE